MTGALLAALVFAVPAAAFALWPLLRPQAAARGFLALPIDTREQLAEQKRQILRALRELQFEHDAGHVSDGDYDELRARYESEAARVLAELDRLGAPPAPPVTAVPATAAPRRSPWRHPLALTAAALALVVFGVGLGAGIVQYTAPDTPAGPMPGSRPPGPAEETPAGGPPAAGGEAPRTVTPEVMQGMLRAARSSLFEGRYTEAIAAYQAVLKRDPKNVDALTHLGLIVALGGHADSALETFDKALALDPRYAPALLYRGQVLYDAKKDTAGAVKSWETFVAVVPAGEERERVRRMIAEAKAGTLKATPLPR